MITMRNQFLETVELSQKEENLRLSELPFLRGQQLAQILDGPHIADTSTISSSRVHRWIHARANAHPEAIALYSAESREKMTYAKLDQQATKKAHYLCNQGVGPGDVVLLHLQRGFAVISWILGVLKAGACFVILDQTLPVTRKQAIARVSGAAHCVTDVDHVENLFVECAFRPAISFTGKVGKEISQQPSQPLADRAKDNDLAYSKYIEPLNYEKMSIAESLLVVFTSGSTGQPKGVMVEHSNLSHYVSAARSVVKIGPNTQVLQFATFAFDASILEWAVSLSFGATLCFVDHPQLLVGEYLADVIDQNKINFFHCTPTVLATLPWERPLPSLRKVSVGGEASSAGLLGKWSKRLEILHAYGPTETT